MINYRVSGNPSLEVLRHTKKRESTSIPFQYSRPASHGFRDYLLEKKTVDISTACRSIMLVEDNHVMQFIGEDTKLYTSAVPQSEIAAQKWEIICVWGLLFINYFQKRMPMIREDRSNHNLVEAYCSSAGTKHKSSGVQATMSPVSLKHISSSSVNYTEGFWKQTKQCFSKHTHDQK